MTEEFEYLSVEQAATEIGVSIARIKQWLDDGTLAGKRLGKRPWAIHRDEVKRMKKVPVPTLGCPRGKRTVAKN